MTKKVYLSKSKYCKAVQCNKILWLDKFKPEYAIQTAKESVLTTGTEVGELARNLFGPSINIKFDKDVLKMVEETRNIMNQKPNIITEASFQYEKNFCSIDILKNEIDGLIVYEVKSSTEIHDIYLDDISYQVYILKKLGYKIKSANIVYLNNNYERKGALELSKLFKIEDVTSEAFSRISKIEQKLEELENYFTEEEPIKDIDMHCFEPYPCPYWNYCTKNISKPNVFDIHSMRKSTKFKLYHQGIYQFEELLHEDINPKYKQQIEFELYDKGQIFDKDGIKQFLNTLTYPLYFLDFETYQQAIPEFDDVKPYMQIPFQYSLHYQEKETGELYHKEFLAEAGMDPRRKLAEQLVKDIPSNTCVLAYNMGFEKGVIKNLASIYPDLSEHLMKIHENIKDLMIPFSGRMCYCKEMQGSYSIKYVLPALFPSDPSLDYHNLSDIHNGSEAMSAFADLPKMSKEEQKIIRKSLLEYCKLDTYAMVKIYLYLKEKIKEEE